MCPGKNDDFRSYRYKQPVESFIFGGPEGENPNAEDLIDEETWFNLNCFSDDVCLRTSENHGKELRIMYETGEYLNFEQSNQGVDAFWPFMIDITDEFQGSLFNLLYGYYRVSASCLRNALELSLYGLYFQMLDSYDNALLWLNGDYENRKFRHIQRTGNVCNQLNRPKKLKQLNFILSRKLGFSLFNQKSPSIRQGISRQLYSDLSKYVHSRPGYGHCKHWNNYEYGPIYSKESFEKISKLYLDTFVLVNVFVQLAWPTSQVDEELYKEIFSSKLLPSSEIETVILTLWPEI